MDKTLSAIEKTLEFIIEIEKLKDVYRKTKPVGLDRYENSAEHSWHVCISALMLKDYANEEVDIDKVIKMLLIHDLGEIDVGDTIIYNSETKEQKEEEAAGVKRILSLLPLDEESLNNFMTLWYEFEAGETAESKFAKAMDRVPPLLHNLKGGGHSWQSHQIPPEKVYKLNSRIAQGSEPLWQVLKNMLDTAVEDGLFKKPKA